MKRLLTAWVILLAVAATFGAAPPPGTLNYQGVLRNADGSPREGSHDMIFHFFDAATEGTELLTEQHAVAVTGGVFNVQLGSGTMITPGAYDSLSELFRNHGEVWMEIQVGVEILSPRVQVLAEPYALNADHLDGHDSAFFLDGMDLGNHASGTTLIDTILQDCTASILGDDCSEVHELVVNVPYGMEAVIRNTTFADAGCGDPDGGDLELVLTRHRVPTPPVLPDGCHPGVEIAGSLTCLGQTFTETHCLSPSSPLSAFALQGILDIKGTLLAGSWVRLRLVNDGFEADWPEPFTLVTVYSSARITSTTVRYRPDGTARVDVDLTNLDALRASYLVEITDCTTSCTEPPPDAQAITLGTDPFDIETLTFDLPTCGGEVGTNECTVRLISATGAILHTATVSF